MIYNYYFNVFKIFKYRFQQFNIKFLPSNIKINLKTNKILYKILYVKLLYKILLVFKQNLNYLKKLKKNWRFWYFQLFSTMEISIKLKFFKQQNLNLNLVLDLTKNTEDFYTYLNNILLYYKRKNIFNFKNKLLLQATNYFDQNITILNTVKYLFKGFSQNLIKYYTIFQSKKNKIKLKFVEFLIQIRIKKNNIFLILRNKYLNKIIFFISAGRIFKGKKKRNYLTGRFLSKTFIRLLVRFFFKFNLFLSKNKNYFFIVEYNTMLKHFLTRSIINSFKYFYLPIIFVYNKSTFAHSGGLTLKKVRRL